MRPNHQGFYRATTALERVAVEIIGISARIRIRTYRSGQACRFRMDLDDIDSADKIRGAHYLNHKMYTCIVRNEKSLRPLLNGYLRMNENMAEYFMDDILEDWLAEAFEKEKNAMAREYRLYSRSPYIAHWHFIDAPLTEESILETHEMRAGGIGAMILCPEMLQINETMLQLLSENVNYHAEVHLNENFREVTSIYCAKVMEGNSSLFAPVDHLIRRTHAKGTVAIMFFKNKGGRVSYHPYVFSVMGL